MKKPLRVPMYVAAVAAAMTHTLPAVAGDDTTLRSVAPVAGAAIPGANILSARVVTLTPVSGGETRSVPLAADGRFQASGLTPGHYRLGIRNAPVARQTQGATFGERVQAGLAQTGSAISQGASLTTKHDTAKNSIGNVRRETVADGSGSAPAGAQSSDAQGAGKIDDSMPNRISMNVTVARRQFQLTVDGEPIEVEVGADGNLTGIAVAR